MLVPCAKTCPLTVDIQQEWKKQLPYYLSLPPKGPSFYAQIYHPAFNVDADDATDAIDRFVGHTKAVGKGVQGLRNTFGRVREARIGQLPLSGMRPTAHGCHRDVQG